MSREKEYRITWTAEEKSLARKLVLELLEGGPASSIELRHGIADHFTDRLPSLGTIDRHLHRWRGMGLVESIGTGTQVMWRLPQPKDDSESPLTDGNPLPELPDDVEVQTATMQFMDSKHVAISLDIRVPIADLSPVVAALEGIGVQFQVR